MEYGFLSNRQIHDELLTARILKARHSLSIATANLKDIHVENRGTYHSILKSFRALASAGVDIRILHASVPSESYLRSLKEHQLIGAENFTMRRCPRVHFKCAIIDDRWSFMGSPNFTGAGIGAKEDTRRNFEAGILTEAPEFRDELMDLFNIVWEGEMCEDCGRKEYCPVPLEEPDF